METGIRAWRDGRVGRIVLDRPETLNALDLTMIRVCQRALNGWLDDPHVHSVVIEGTGERAFCAGGDVRTIRKQAIAGERHDVETFFREEYALDQTVAEYPKPYLALVDGICMGGGVGLSVHGSIRVASERAVFAMPETAIGFFPDIGGGYFLPRLPGSLGLYYGLTGARAQGANAVHAGFATHFVPSARLPALSQALARDGVAVLAGFTEKLPPFSLAAYRAAIDRCFNAGGVREIVANLEAEGTEWAGQALRALRKASPSALFWAFETIRRGAGYTLRQCFEAELALACRAAVNHEFLEGVRAMVVDKDRRPNWNPPRIEDVDEAAVAAMLS
ncbi:MAG: enoyl-CoA hydratase/isomerase family protein [Acetobacteraceae bacterium]|nr:enoyl-CoA hydratase/isomerase family protein [Acetobacteraceae bacterium]